MTQNIDNLHEKAGSTIIRHIHGELYKSKCHLCDYKEDYIEGRFGQDCPQCDNGLIRPDVVLFKETPKYINDIFKILYESDLFIQVGTSGTVYPAANLIRDFKEYTGKVAINISKELPKNNGFFDYSFVGNATEWLPIVTDKLLTKINL